jgi:hypothetical protein
MLQVQKATHLVHIIRLKRGKMNAFLGGTRDKRDGIEEDDHQRRSRKMITCSPITHVEHAVEVHINKA